jgi:AMMECR1 domain-containing protein
VRLGRIIIQCAWVVLLTTAALPVRAWSERTLLRLARAAVTAEVEAKDSPRCEEHSPPEPVFVTIERKGRILGCRGSLECRSRSLEGEVLLAARAAAGHDPRYRPLTPKDLADFQVTVTIVHRLEPLDRVEALSPADGLVLRSGNRTGVVLPWEGKAPQVRLEWAYTKAGVHPGAPCALYRLIAERFRSSGASEGSAP